MVLLIHVSWIFTIPINGIRHFHQATQENVDGVKSAFYKKSLSVKSFVLTVIGYCTGKKDNGVKTVLARKYRVLTLSRPTLPPKGNQR